MRKLSCLLLVVLTVTSLLLGCSSGPSPLEVGMESLENGDLKQAEESFNQAIEQEIEPGDAYRGIGIIKFEQEDYAAAKEAFEAALNNEAEKTGTLYHLVGTCCFLLEDYQGALNYYNIGISCEDCSEEMIQEMKYNTIVCYEKCGEWDNAKTKINEYVSQYPEDERMTKEAEFFHTQN